MTAARLRAVLCLRDWILHLLVTSPGWSFSWFPSWLLMPQQPPFRSDPSPAQCSFRCFHWRDTVLSLQLWFWKLTCPPVTNEHSVLNPTSLNNVRQCVLKSILVPSNILLEPILVLINLEVLLNVHVAHTFTFKFWLWHYSSLLSINIVKFT